MFVDAPLARRSCRPTLDLPVVVDNDANVAAWGEACHGALRGHRHGLVVTLGTGVGGGDHRGRSRSTAARTGSRPRSGTGSSTRDGPRCACGEIGHWEAVASGTALGRLGRDRAACRRGTRRARARGRRSPMRSRACTSATAHRPASRRPRDPRRVRATSVALGFAGLANILDPEIIVVSGGLVELGDVLLDPLRAAFAGHLEGAAHRPAGADRRRRARRRTRAWSARPRWLATLVAMPREARPHAAVVRRGPATIPLDVARAAEDAGLDGVFVYDHCSVADATATRRPALEGVSLARRRRRSDDDGRGRRAGASARGCARPRSLAAAIATVGPDRTRAGRSRRSAPATPRAARRTRVRARVRHDAAIASTRSRAAVVAAHDRGSVGLGRWSRAVGARGRGASEADGWNAWGGDVDAVRVQVEATARDGGRAPTSSARGAGSSCSVRTTRRARAKAERLGASDRGDRRRSRDRGGGARRATATAGADWVIVGAGRLARSREPRGSSPSR